jgi:hypothetical protein
VLLETVVVRKINTVCGFFFMFAVCSTCTTGSPVVYSTKINVGHRVCGTRLHVTVGLDMPLFFLFYLPGYPL